MLQCATVSAVPFSTTFSRDLNTALDVYHVSGDSDVFIKYQEEIFGAGVVISLSYMKQSCIHMEWITVFALLVFYLKCSKLAG